MSAENFSVEESGPDISGRDVYKNGAHLNYDHPECKYIRLFACRDGSEQDLRRRPSHSMTFVRLDPSRIFAMSDRGKPKVGDTRVTTAIYENIRLGKRQQALGCYRPRRCETYSL